MGRAGRGAVMATALMGLGCASDKSFALVSVLSAAGQFTDVAQLQVAVVNGGYQDFLTYPAMRMGTYRFDETQPLTFSVGFRSTFHSGLLQVTVTTVDAAGTPTGHGTGMAEISAENVTAVTVRVTRGAPAVDGGADAARDAGAADLPPACDPAAAATACGAGKTCIAGCRANGTSAAMCVMAGNKAPGAACADDCVQGAECARYPCAGAEVRACLRLCTDDAECGEGRCNLPVPCAPPDSYRWCSQPCNPVGAATGGCAPGLRCFLYAGEIPDCNCPGDRTGVDGTPCVDSDSCQAGFFCVRTGTDGTCRPLCRLDAPSCEGARTCMQLFNPNYQTYGACLPP
jgi:hypothetical protein